MKKRMSLVALGLCVLLLAKAQMKNQYWSKSSEAELTRTSKNVFDNNYKPNAFLVFNLDETSLKNELKHAPLFGKISASESNMIISVPNAKGLMERFSIVEFSNMSDELAAQYPDIKSYAGKGIDEPNSTIRFSVSPLGFDAMILSSVRKTIYINAINSGKRSYIVFDRNNLSVKKDGFDCLLETVTSSDIQGKIISTEKNADDGKLRTYRLALCTTGEYATAALNGAGGTDAQKKAIILAILNNNLTRANGIYERDFGVHMNFVTNETDIIYLNAATDPWGAKSGWNTKTQQTCDNQIGNANYDIGHLITKAANDGNAGCIGCVCTSGSKGSGYTAHNDVEGDPLVVDYWTHEMGHQFGANHTYTYVNEGSVVQVEPGSGSTIMGYAGITGSTDVQAHSDDYFQAITISQVTDYIKTGNGSTCDVVTNTGDNLPTANAGADYTIPKSTPFQLTGTGTDADGGDVLSYCWEQMDDYTAGSNTFPTASSASGPQFRSYSPNSSVTRVFPKLSSILSGTNSNTWEVLSTANRTLSFRFTVRDNQAGGGQNNSDDMIVTMSTGTGPFSVTQPNTNVTWGATTSQTITWNVAGTTGSPVNCANVKILLSTDGGNTFPEVLAASTPNDGSETVTLPDLQSTQCRVKIEAVGNIFFDISNTNFTLASANFCSAPTGLAEAGITNTSADLSWTVVATALTYDVDYRITGSGTWIPAITATASTSYSLTSLSSGTAYDWRVRANCSVESSAYSQDAFTTTGGAICPSAYDNVANESFAQAVAIPLNTDVQGKISPKKDKDYYSFVITTGGTITITLSTLPDDYDLILYNSAQAKKGSSTNSGATTETINYTATAGTYYIRVAGFQGANNAASCYTLRVQTGTASRPGIIAGMPEIKGIKVFPNPVSNTLNISLQKIAAGSVLNVYNSDGKVVMSKPALANMNVNVKGFSPGIYFIKVIDNEGEEAYSTKFIKQ